MAESRIYTLSEPPAARVTELEPEKCTSASSPWAYRSAFASPDVSKRIRREISFSAQIHT